MRLRLKSVRRRNYRTDEASHYGFVGPLEMLLSHLETTLECAFIGVVWHVAEKRVFFTLHFGHDNVLVGGKRARCR